MPDNQIFKATYSGIPVYEMMCKGVAVMRRRSDSWLNATQILKVAGFDKPQRTRVLEREVQKGEHEKVQGGYGKYQGTWIPLERGLSLARQYHCEVLLRPIIDYQPTAKSPPLAPKHLAASAGPKPPRRGAADLNAVNTRASRRQVPEEGIPTDRETISDVHSEDGSMTPSPTESSASSRTPSPIRSPAPEYRLGSGSYAFGHRKPTREGSRYDNASDEELLLTNGAMDSRTYGDQLLEYFISDTNHVPAILVHPPTDFDPNMALDDDGHTPLHWACAMGRVRIAKLLLTAGADIFKVNKSGQTALMRSVMFANNYDVRKFPELYELLHRSTLNIDNYNRTVFHHIVDVAMSKGKTHAARYYMETVLNRLADYPRELADVINFQDEDGETALTLAARCRSKRLVKILIDHGADPKVANNDGKSTEDYILEDERFRASPAPPSRAQSMSYRNAQLAYPSNSRHPASHVNGGQLPLHYSVTAQKASTHCTNEMANLLGSLASSFDQELREKERDMAQAQALLTNIQAEILESRRAGAQLKYQGEALPTEAQTLQEIQTKLHTLMGKQYRLGWEQWVKDEELREHIIRDAAGGELAFDPTTTARLEAAFAPMDSAPENLKAKGKLKALTRSDDISDLQALHGITPTDPDALRQACDALREEISNSSKRRVELFNELVTFQAEADTSDKMNDYRRLIAVGCGIPEAEVDQVLPMLLETLEAEEPSSSSNAWNSSR
ncbi:hypothetical protein HGRIS_009266 [Hohenbuehelia grisea]|uniref:HTH APSES-type domain-containing protein n=1 Tax=Hohenbuehelia grisea TaxID=104357 RepID=A0ABR3J0Q6_9AGAR